MQELSPYVAEMHRKGCCVATSEDPLSRIVVGAFYFREQVGFLFVEAGGSDQQHFHLIECDTYAIEDGIVYLVKDDAYVATINPTDEEDLNPKQWKGYMKYIETDEGKEYYNSLLDMLFDMSSSFLSMKNSNTTKTGE